jgi:ketosteroid isomerase-like protein
MKRFALASSAVALLACLSVIPAAFASSHTEMSAEAGAKAVVDQFNKIFESEDIAAFDRVFAHDADAVSFGTDAAERFVGYDALKKSVEAQFASFEGSKLTVRDEVVKASRAGDAAWFSEVVDWDTKAGGEAVSLKGCRFTGVLEKRDDGWKVVQFHASMPVQGQAAQY